MTSFVPVGFNDRVNAVRIFDDEKHKNWVVVFFEHANFEGNFVTIVHDQANLGEFGFGGIASSAIVQNCPAGSCAIRQRGSANRLDRPMVQRLQSCGSEGGSKVGTNVKVTFDISKDPTWSNLEPTERIRYWIPGPLGERSKPKAQIVDWKKGDKIVLCLGTAENIDAGGTWIWLAPEPH